MKRLQSFLAGDYNKKYQCKICNCWANNILCSNCEKKLELIKKDIRVLATLLRK
jgi:hypothetical protein